MQSIQTRGSFLISKSRTTCVHIIYFYLFLSTLLNTKIVNRLLWFQREWDSQMYWQY